MLCKRIGLLALALGLTACGVDDGSSGTAPSETSGSAQSPPAGSTSGSTSGSSSGSTSGSTPADTTRPATPAGLTATAASASQINLSWTASTDNVGVTGYIVRRNGVQAATTASASYADTGLSAGTTYNYAVAARDAAGNISIESSSASATTTSSPSSSGSLPWEREQVLGTSAYPAGYVVASGSVVHAIVVAEPVTYRRSTDEGSTWSEPVVLGGLAHLNDPIAADGQRVWVVYLANLWGATDMPCCPRVLGDLFLRRSLDGGQSWLPAQRLTSGAGAFRISMAVSGGRVHIAWMDYRTFGWDVRYLRSEDSGATWEPEKIIVAGGFASRPQVAALGDRVAIVYGRPPVNAPLCFAGEAYQSPCSETYALTSKDGGASFASPVQVTPSLVKPPAVEADLSFRADVALLAPSTIVVTWDESQNSTGWPGGFRTEQYARVSVDDGVSWREPVRLTDSPNSTHNALVASGSGVHVAWFDSRDGNDEIYYRASLDGGLTWKPEERLTYSPASSSTPSVAVSTSYVHVMWLEGNSETRYRRRKW